jgi:hypothetical protein
VGVGYVGDDEDSSSAESWLRDANAFLLLRERFGATDVLYGSYRLLRLDDDGSSSGDGRRRGVERMGDVSGSSASPRYRGMPSTPISTFGGFLKWVLSRYSGEISRDASSGSVDGERRRPCSTSSTL